MVDESQPVRLVFLCAQTEFGVDGERMKKAKTNVLLLAPGPINRGVEVTPEVADGPNSAILDQVTNGLAIRMAVLSELSKAA